MSYMSEKSIEEQNKLRDDELTKEDFKVIFDVLNVYDPNDISHVYPEMGTKEFMDDVLIVWEKVLKICRNNSWLSRCNLSY